MAGLRVFMGERVRQQELVDDQLRQPSQTGLERLMEQHRIVHGPL